MNEEIAIPAESNATDLVSLFPRLFPGIIRYSVILYQPLPSRRRRVRSSVRQHEDLRSRLEVSVRESIRQHRSGASRDYDRIVHLRKDQLRAGRLMDLARIAGSHRALALRSRVELSNGKVRHIPMMDLRCNPRRVSARAVGFAMRSIGQSDGVVLRSGRSYHYYGFTLLDEVQWTVFLGRCLLLDQFTDVRYVGHRLNAGSCELRLTACEMKPKVPQVVLRLASETN